MAQRDTFSPKPDLKLGKYRHYKGGEYAIIALACDEETHEWLVVYRPLYDPGDLPDTWVRKYDAFVEVIVVDGKKIKRFEAIND